MVNDCGQLLLGKRAVEPARGQWCLPGGFVELGESMEQAALRELQEETGLVADSGAFVGCFYQNSLYYGGVIIFGYRIDAVRGEPTAGDDMQELQYYSFDRLPPIAFESHRRLIELFKQQLSGSSYPAAVLRLLKSPSHAHSSQIRAVLRSSMQDKMQCPAQAFHIL